MFLYDKKMQLTRLENLSKENTLFMKHMILKSKIENLNINTLKQKLSTKTTKKAR